MLIVHTIKISIALKKNEKNLNLKFFLGNNKNEMKDNERFLKLFEKHYMYMIYQYMIFSASLIKIYLYITPIWIMRKNIEK